MRQNIIIRTNFFLISTFAVLIALTSCDEDIFLEETPKDFYSPEIAYVTYEDFNAAVLDMHRQYRSLFVEDDGSNGFLTLTHSLTELAYPNRARWDNVQSILLPTNTSVIYNALWRPMYRIIYDANVILERAVHENVTMTEEQVAKIKAEASFFRGHAYKLLANIYGGVPIVLEETKEPRRDYTRASRQEVYQQCIADMEFALANLPDIDETPDLSRLNKLTASHVLAELYISLERWDEAIDAASYVIDHPSTGLMTERFGNKVRSALEVHVSIEAIVNVSGHK